MIRDGKRLRHEPPKVDLQTIQVTLRVDEVEFLDIEARKANRTRQQLLRSILRGGIKNPLPAFFDQIAKREGWV